jgi:hypothetical protein
MALCSLPTEFKPYIESTVWLVSLVVDLQSRNFLPPKINDYRYVKYRWGAWPKTSWKCSHPFSVLASNNRYCHPANGVFNANIVPSHAICLSVFAEVAQRQRKSSEIENAYQLHHRLRSTPPLDWVDVTKFKIILRAFSDFPLNLHPRKLPTIR